MQNRIRGMVEGAFMSAIFLVLFLLAFYTPLGALAVFALPVPFTIYGYRHSIRLGIMALAVAVLLVFIFANITGLIVALPSAVLGLAMGAGYRLRKSIRQVIVRGTLVSLVFLFLSIGFSIYVFHVNPVDVINKIFVSVIGQVQSQVDAMIQHPPAGQGSAESVQKLEQTRQMLSKAKEQVPLMTAVILPASLILSALVSALLNHAISRRVLKRMGTQIEALPALHHLRFPRSILYYYLIVLVLVMIPDVSHYRFLYMIAMNGNVLLQTLLFIQGLGVIAYLIHVRGWNKALLIGAVILFLIPSFTYILIIVGMVDIGFDLRSRFFQK